MPDILHRVGLKGASTDDAYRALATIEGLSAWWTNDTQGKCEPGGTLSFRFGSNGGFDMKVTELDPGKRVCWQVVDGPAEWIGTTIAFDLRREGDFAIVLFRHEGWKEPVEFMHHCTTKWGTFLMSLKSFVETGTGAPYPNDVLIDDWR